MTSILKPGPAAVAFLLGDQCNANCRMCRHQGVRTSQGTMRWPELRPDRWPNTVEQWPELPISAVEGVVERYRSTLRSVTISSFGEPTLHSDFGRLFQAVSANRRSVGMITNGSRLRELAALVAPVPGWLTVSIDSADPARFHEIRRNLDLAEIVAGVDAVLQHPHRHPARCVNVNMTLTIENISEISSMLKLCRSHGIQMLTLLRAESLELTDVEGTELSMGDLRVREQYKGHQKNQLPTVVDCCSSGWWTRLPGRCSAPWEGFDVNPDGSCVPCCRAPDCVIGQVGEDIWRDDRFQELRSQLSARKVDPARFYGCFRCPASRLG